LHTFFVRQPGAAGKIIGFMLGDVSFGPVGVSHGLRLNVDGHGNMGDPPVADGCAAGQVGHISRVRGPHHAGVVDAHILEEPVEFDVLLGMRV
jgi:hypothetical protein